ncbi:MAG TPA: hypothetical protein VLL76_03680 [Candidatus Omnitrophota bacterium]|nr:hypothetical protein [Candidatus Omnitrophota bacterium]
MPDDGDLALSLQESELMRAIAMVTGRPPRIIEIPPPRYEAQDDGRRAEEMGTDG